MRIYVKFQSILLSLAIVALTLTFVPPIHATADLLPEFNTTFTPKIPTSSELQGLVSLSQNSLAEGVFAQNLINHSEIAQSPTRLIIKFSANFGSTSVGANSPQSSIQPSNDAQVYSQFTLASNSLAREYGAVKNVSLTEFDGNSPVFQRWEFANSKATTLAKSSLGKTNGVISIRPDITMQIQKIPNDSSYSSLWGMSAINAPTAWDKTTGSQSVVTAVIDTGIDLDHPDLIDNIWTNTGEIANDGIDNDNNGYVDDIHGWDFVDGDAVPNDDLTDSGNNVIGSAGHGTHVSGTIAGIGNNGVGVSGVNWQGSLMALRICGKYGCYLSDFWAALNYAYNNGAQVANASFGGNYQPFLDEENIIRSVSEPGMLPKQKGVLVVAAAGNNASNNDTTNFCPACYQLPNMVSVAAVNDSNGQLASFSNYGAQKVTIAAPGESIFSTLPPGAFGYTGYYGSLNGTSMAAPHVAGVASLFLSQSPTWSPSAIKKALIRSARATSKTMGKVYSGGVVDAAQVLTVLTVPQPFLTLDLKGTGSGIVQINGVECSADCIKEFASGTAIEIVAIANANSNFSSWAGACAGSIDTKCILNQTPSGLFISVTFNGPPLVSHTQIPLESSASIDVWNNSTLRNYFYNSVKSAISSDGTTRARGIFRFPSGGWCSYSSSETGGLTVQKESESPAKEEHVWNAPYVGTNQPMGRWSNCGNYARDFQISDDGNYLSVNLGSNIWVNDWNDPSQDFTACGTILYKRTGSTWSEGVVLSPTDLKDCYAQVIRTSNSWSGMENWRASILAPDHTKLFVKGFNKIHVLNLNEDSVSSRESFSLPLGCMVSSNLASDNSGSKVVVPVFACSEPANALLYSRGANGWVLTKRFSDTSSYIYGTTKTTISRDGSLISLSYTNETGSGVLIYEFSNAAWNLSKNLNALESFQNFTNCSFFSSNNSKLLCDARYSNVGANEQQGVIVIYDRAGSTWRENPYVSFLWDTNGSPMQGLTYQGSNASGTLIDSAIDGVVIGSGDYATNFMGVTFVTEVGELANITIPQISGNFRSGSQITSTSGTWNASASPQLSYEWFICSEQNSDPSLTCTKIVGATTNKFLISDAEVNKYIRVAVTASIPGDSLRIFSAATELIGKQPVATTPILIQGNALYGNFLKVVEPIWTGSPTPTYNYSWYSCTSAISVQTQIMPNTCTAIGTANSTTYTPLLGDIGKFLSVKVSATNIFGSAQAWSVTTPKIESIPINISAPTLTGSNLIGQTLSVSQGVWSGSATITYSYQWLACKNTTTMSSCVNISNATKNTFKLTASQQGQYVRVKVSASNKNGSLSTFTSPTNLVGIAPAVKGSIALAGSAFVGSTLRSLNSLKWTGFPIPTVRIQWIRCTKAIPSQQSLIPNTCVTIPNATITTYVLAQDDLNKYVSIAHIGSSATGTIYVVAPSLKAAIR